MGLLLASCGDPLFADNLYSMANGQGPRHPHNGKLTPYEGAPPTVPLSESEKRDIENNKPVKKTLDVPNGGSRGVAVFRVKAPAKTTWAVISNFEKYSKWIDACSDARVYRREGDRVFVAFKIHHWLTGTITYYIEHNFPGERSGWGTWKLDYDNKSEIDDSVGFWRVAPVMGNPNQVDVSYSIDVLPGGIANAIKDILVRQGLDEATSWVKKQAEAAYGNKG
jgi:hypothetical protein